MTRPLPRQVGHSGWSPIAPRPPQRGQGTAPGERDGHLSPEGRRAEVDLEFDLGIVPGAGRAARAVDPLAELSAEDAAEAAQDLVDRHRLDVRLEGRGSARPEGPAGSGSGRSATGQRVVVLPALLRIGENLVGPGQFLELLLRLLVSGVPVRMDT